LCHCLGGCGVAILNAGDLGWHNAGKVTLKTVHTWIGYAFVLNLLWGIAWEFFGNRTARWRSILPGGGVFSGPTPLCRGLFSPASPNNTWATSDRPVCRWPNAAAHDSSRQLLSGADRYRSILSAHRYWIAQWVAACVAPDSLVPYAPEMYDAAAYETMRAFRKTHCSGALVYFYYMMSSSFCM